MTSSLVCVHTSTPFQNNSSEINLDSKLDYPSDHHCRNRLTNRQEILDSVWSYLDKLTELLASDKGTIRFPEKKGPGRAERANDKNAFACSSDDELPSAIICSECSWTQIKHQSFDDICAKLLKKPSKPSVEVDETDLTEVMRAGYIMSLQFFADKFRLPTRSQQKALILPSLIAGILRLYLWSTRPIHYAHHLLNVFETGKAWPPFSALQLNLTDDHKSTLR
ncbi:hypothetical protein BGX28_010333 [Mortierella sp. GBA30]|nr:hypothetical protein BGX28_010333 [Mortierella sp. GBA30]